MPWLLIPAHLLALSAWLWLSRWEARKNAALIEANGAKDSLGTAFHVGRTALRLSASLLLAAAPLLLCPRLLASIGLFAGMWGWFGYYFGPALNQLRGKAWYYVSFSRTTALLDKWLAWLAYRAYPVFELGGDTQATAADRQAYAANLLKRLGWVALGGGGVVWLGCLVYVVVTGCR